MNRFRAWGIAVALAAGTAAPAGAADPSTDPDTTDTRPWYKKMFFSAPKPPVGPTVRTGAVAAPPGRPPMMAPLPPEVVAEAVKAEYVAWDRRMKVCDAIREAAIARQDDALMRQVDELERQANVVYQQRVAALGVPKVKAPLPKSTEGGLAGSFKLAPEKIDDPTAAAARLVAPAAPVAVSGTASAPQVPPGSTFREVKP